MKNRIGRWITTRVLFDPAIVRSILFFSIMMFVFAGTILFVAFRRLQVQSWEGTWSILSQELDTRYKVVESRVLYVQRSLVRLRDNHSANKLAYMNRIDPAKRINLCFDIEDALADESVYHQSNRGYYHFTQMGTYFFHGFGLLSDSIPRDSMKILDEAQYASIQPLKVNAFTTGKKTRFRSIVSDVYLAMELQIGINFGYVALEINGEELVRDLDDSRIFEEATFIILNDNMDPIYANGNIRSIVPTELVDALRDNRKPYRLKIGETEYFIVRRMSSYTNWTYINILPQNVIKAANRPVNVLLITIGLLTSLLGTFLMAILTIKLYKPVQNLFKRISNTETSTKSNISAITAIGDAYDRVLQRNRNLTEKMQENMPLVQDKYLLQLLFHIDTDVRMIQTQLTQLGLNFPNRYFRVIVVAIKQKSMKFDEMDFLRAEFIQVLLRESIGSESTTHIIQFAPHKHVAVINYNILDLRSLFSHFTSRFTELKNRHELTLYAGISSEVDSFCRIDIAFKEAYEACDYSVLMDYETVIFYDRIDTVGSAFHAVYPFHLEQKLLSAIRAGDRTVASGMLQALKNHFIEQPIHDFCVRQMIMYLYSSLNRIRIELADSEMDREYLSDQFLRRIETNSSINASFDLLDEIISQLVEDFSEQRRRRPHRLLARILKYIETHYHDVCSAEEIASSVYISVPSLYKLFQDHYEKTPMAYLNEVRVRKATEMLRSTRLSIKDIARKCGYSNQQAFFRQFKKIMHMTAMQYRQNIAVDGFPDKK